MGPRLLFIDNIRWSLIVLVTRHLAAVTYSHVGRWYYTDGSKPPLGVTFLFMTFETFAVLAYRGYSVG